MQSADRMGVFYRHYDLPAGFPAVALLGEGWNSTPDPVTRLHFHNCVEIGLLYEGSCKCIFEDGEITVQSPAVTVIPPNRPHFTQSCPGSVCHWNWIYADPIRLPGTLSPRQMNEMYRYLHFVRDSDCVIENRRAPGVIRLVQLILDEMGRQELHYKTAVRGLFTALFMMLFRLETDAEEQSEGEQLLRSGRILPAVTAITDHYMDSISVEDLAKDCHLSVTHFRRLFRQMTGWSPQEYLHTVRIGHACDILFNEDVNVTEAALRVGYSTTSGLTRQFNRLYGISPNQWRKRARKEENPDVVSYLGSVPASLRKPDD